MDKLFINPNALFMTPKVVGTVGQPAVGTLIPRLPLPPTEKHYTQVLDALWAEFDEPGERTAARLDAVLAETIDEAQRILQQKIQIWETPSYKLPESERQRFDKEFSEFLARLNGYRQHLSQLTPASLDTDEVYIGLVRRRDGAGPVPDAIMPIYFAKQLGILEDHAADMSEGFVARVMASLERIDEVIDDSVETVEDLSEESSEKLEGLINQASGQIGAGLKTAGMWVAGAIAGTLIVGGTIAAVVLGNRRSKEPQP